MKRSRIGDSQISEDVFYWTGGKRYSQLRQSEKEIYAKIDLYQEYAGISDDPQTVDYYYTEMDKLFVILCLISEFGSDQTQLEKSGIAFSQIDLNQQFQSHYSSLDERNRAVNNIVSKCIELTFNIELSESIQLDFMIWFRDVVLNQNYYLIEGSGKCVPVAPPADSSIGDITTGNYSAQLKEGGAYYMYVVADSRLVDTPESLHKKQMQFNQLIALKNADVGLSEYVMIDNITAGIINKTGKTPDIALQEFKSGRDPGIGAVLTIIVTAIIAIITLATAIVKVIQTNRDIKAAEKAAEIQRLLNESATNGQAPIYADFSGDGTPDHVWNPTTKQWEPINKTGEAMPYIVAGGAALLLLFALMN
jgi:hypothetical protein